MSFSTTMAIMSIKECERLRKDYDDLKQKWDYYQDLCKLHGANGITELIVQRDDYAKQLKELQEFVAKDGYTKKLQELKELLDGTQD